MKQSANKLPGRRLVSPQRPGGAKSERVRRAYDTLVSRYEDTERKRDAIVEQINQIMIRRRKIERFIESVKELPKLITGFDESLWAGLGNNGNP